MESIPWGKTTKDVQWTNKILERRFFILSVRTINYTIAEEVARNTSTVGALELIPRASCGVKERSRSNAVLFFTGSQFVALIPTVWYTVTNFIGL